MALQAIGNVNLEFANTGRTSTVDLYYTQPRPDTWARAEGINSPDYPTYLQYIPWGTTSVIDSGGSVITTYNQHNNLPTPSVPSNSYMMIVKFNPTSNVMWRRQIPHTGETSAVLKSMCLDTDDNAYLLFDIIGTKDIRVIKVNNKTAPQSNLVLHLDANTSLSYPGTGTLWYNLANNIPSAAANLTNDNYSPYYGQLPPTYSNASGGQIVFTGNYGYVNIASEIVLGNTYTISAWIKTNYFYWNTLFSRSSIPISYGDPIKSIGVIISEYNQDGKLYAGGGTSNSSESFYKIHDTFIRDGQWHHVAAVFDQTANTITGYVDGVQGLTVSASFDGSSYSSSRNQIGKISHYNSQTFSGNIHQFLIHSRALSSEEISRLSRSFGSATPSVAWAKNYYVPGAYANADSANGVNRIVEKNGKLYISTSYSGLLSVETSNGNIAWTRYVDGSKANTQLVYSSVLNGNVYSISAGGFYHVHNFNANTGNWNDTKTYFNYPGIFNIFNYGLNDGLGVVATDGYDLYIRQWTTVTKVEGANTNNVIWYNYISNGYPGGYYYQPYTEVGWTDLTFDIEPTSNSANQFYTFGRFYRGDFYTYAPVVQRINKDNGAVNKAIFIPFAPLTNLNGYESKKYVLSVRNANVVFSGFDFTNDNKGNVGWKSITYKMKENFDVLDYYYGANAVYVDVYSDSYYFFSNSKPNIASYVYTWNPISVTTNNITITLNTPSPPAGRQFNEDRAWGFPNVENYIDGWIPDTRQAIGMEANSVINQPNSKSFFSVFGANSGLGDRNYTYTETVFNNMDLDSEGNIITIGKTDMGENTQYKEVIYTEKAQLTKWSKEGDVIWSKTIRGTSNIADVYIYDGSWGVLTKVDKRNDDVYAITQQDYLGSFYLTKFDKNGNYLWNKVLYEQWDFWDIHIDTNGDVYLVGGQPWITVFTESGQYKWGVSYDDWSTNIYPLSSAFDTNTKMLLIGDGNYPNVYAFDKTGNYKWTYSFNNINESGDAILDIAIDDTQANTWYVSNYDSYGAGGNYAYYDGTAITKMQGYVDPQRIVRKFLYSYSGWDWNYTPRMYATYFSKLIPKDNKIYANGGISSNEDGGFQFFRFDKDLTTVDVNTFFVDQDWYRFYQNYWWGSNWKIDSFVVDNEGYMIQCGWWEPWTIAEEPFDEGHYYSYDDRAVILRVPSDGTLAHRWDDRYQNSPFGNVVNPAWRQFSYNRADQVIDLDTNDYFPQANLGWFETDTEPSYGKTTDHADFFRKDKFFNNDENIIDYIWSNVTPLIYNTFDGGFINAAPYNTQVGNFIVLQTANGKSYVNSSSKLLDVSTNLIIGNTLTPVFNVNNKSWAFQSWRDVYPNTAYTGYEFSVDTKIDSKNNVILIDQTQLFTNGNGIAVGVTKFNEYGDQLWSYYTPPSWEGIDTYGVNYTIDAIGSTIDSNDNIYILANRVGNTAQSNTVNAVIAKIDSNGSILWAKRYYDGQSGRYTYLHAQDGMLFMCRSDDYGFPGYVYGYYAYRREAALFRINPDNGDIIWAVDRLNRPFPNQFYCIKKHNNMVLMGCEDYTYFAFDLDGNFLFARKWGAPFYGSSDITGIESDGTNYYLMNVFGVVSKVDGNTHNVIWTNYYYSYPGNQYGNIRYENGTLYLFCPPYSDGAGARVLKIDPTSGNVLYDKYVALDTVPSGRIDYFKVWNSTWSFGFDARYDKASFVGYVEDGSLRDAPSYGERRFLAKLDTSDNLIESDIYSLKPYYANNVTVLSRKTNWTYNAGDFGELQLQISRYEPPEYNVFANVITNPTYTNWIKMNVANIGVVSLTDNLLPTPNTTNGANLYNYTSKRDILSSPYFITTSNNAPVNTNVSINFYGGLTINSHVQAARTYKDSCWVARWGTYNEVNSGYYYNTYYNQIRWEENNYDGESQLNSVCVDSTGNTWSTGWWQNYMLGNGLRPMALKHDKDGKLLKYYAADGPRIFNGVYSGQLYQAGQTITCDANNNVYFQIMDWSYETRPTSMIAFIKLDSEGNLLWKNAIEFAETDLYDGLRMVVNSSANKLFFIMSDYYSDGYPTMMCLNSLTGEYLWSKVLKDIYDDGYGAYEYIVEPVDILTFGNRLYVMTYDAIITMDLDGNIISSKTLENNGFDYEGLSITTDNTNLYILIGSSYYSSNSRIVKINSNNLENPGLFNATWISELNSYSQPKIRSISYSNNKIIAIGSRSNIYNDNDPIVWTIDSATGKTLFAGEITVIGTRWFEYNHEGLNYYNELFGVGGHKAVAVKDKNVYIAGQATYVAMPPYPYYVSDNYPDTALIKLENDSRNFTSQSEHGADPDPSGDYPIIIFNSKNVYSNVINSGSDLSFVDYYYYSGNADTITANSVTYTPISNSANILFGNGIFSDNSIYYYANSTFYKELTPIVKFGEGKTSDILNVDSILTIGRGSNPYFSSSNIQEPLYIWSRSNKTNAVNTVIFAQSFREKAISLMGGANATIDLNLGGIFTYYLTSGVSLNNIIIIENSVAKTANAVQSFTLFTYGVDTVSNSVWANANIAWPRNAVPNKLNGLGFAKVSFMKLPSSNLWYGFYQANTVNVTFAKTKVLNSLTFTKELVSGMPIWGYDTARGNNALIVKFNDATTCGGSNTYSGVKQESTYTFSFENEEDIYLTSMNVTSNVESGRNGYDRLKIIYSKTDFSGTAQTVIYEAFSQDTAGQLTCIGRPAYVNIAPPNNMMLTANTYHRFDLIANTVDNLYHSGSYYSVLFDFRKKT